MSNPEPISQQDFEFWDYVACSRCHLSFIPDNGGPPPVPFWVTECGHVVCNNHLQTDQSCAKCGQPDVQVAPLQRNMDPPMSDWFTSAPQALDTLAFATRLQFESLSSLVRYYKRKCAHQRSLIERMKPALQENKELKRALEELHTRNHQPRERMEPSGVPNSNGKRKMQQLHRDPTTNSSPRSVATPVGPSRLTLPPNQQQPSFAPRQHHSDDGGQSQWRHSQDQPADFSDDVGRPGSQRFTEQYAYAPLPARQGKGVVPPQTLAYNQMHPVRQAQGRQQSGSTHQSDAHIPAHFDHGGSRLAVFRPAQQQPMNRLQSRPQPDVLQMPPPPAPSSFPASSRSSQRVPRHDSFTSQPPATPRGAPLNQSIDIRHGGPSSANTTNAHGGDFSNSRAATPLLQTQRFMPPTPGGRHRFDSSSSTAPGPSSGGSTLMRSGSLVNLSGGGHRSSFFPGGQCPS